MGFNKRTMDSERAAAAAKEAEARAARSVHTSSRTLKA
jgi:hypothetical protein